MVYSNLKNKPKIHAYVPNKRVHPFCEQKYKLYQRWIPEKKSWIIAPIKTANEKVVMIEKIFSERLSRHSISDATKPPAVDKTKIHQEIVIIVTSIAFPLSI